MTHTTTYLDLIRACALNPQEDTPRLMLADHIDSEATTDAERAHAALIRLQVKLTEVEPSLSYLATIVDNELLSKMTRLERGGFNFHELRARSYPIASKRLAEYQQQRMMEKSREHELIGTYSAAWRSPPCERCRGKGKIRFAACIDEQISSTAYRGEIEKSCSNCHGNGSTGAFSEHFPNRTPNTPGIESDRWRHTVTWVRGLPVVEVAFGEMGVVPPAANPKLWVWDFYPKWEEWAIRAVREEGASFKVTGRTPWESSDMQWNWSGVLPGGDVLELAIGPHHTAELAHDALNAAVTSLVVERAYPAPVNVEVAT